MYKACIIGVGFIGIAHVEALRRLGSVEVTAIADYSSAREKARELNIPRGYTDYKEMLDVEKPQVVHICTPNVYHYEAAMYALDRGIHVICEKPLSINRKEAEEMTAYAKEKGLICGVNFSCRYYPQVAQMKNMIAKGDLGEVMTIHGGYFQDWLFYDTDYNWRLESKDSGQSRAFADIGSHWLDLVESVTGLHAVELIADLATVHKKRKKPIKPVETYAGMKLKPEDYVEVDIDTEDVANVLFRFNNGAVGCCNITQVLAGRKNQLVVAIGGDKCSLHWDSEDSNRLWIGKRDGFNCVAEKDPSILYPDTNRIVGYPGGHVEGFPDTMKYNFKEMYDAMLNGGASGGFASFENGLREMLVLEKILESAKERKWVTI